MSRIFVGWLICSLGRGDEMEEFHPVDISSGDVNVSFISRTLGDHMVLQRGPQQAVVWGHTTPGASVQTAFNGKTFSAIADDDGVWRQRLPAMEASLKTYTLIFKSSTGQTGELKDVLFGDVFVCGGQSNMVYAMPATTNHTEEAQLANKYPHIRLFTVGQGTSSKTRLPDLQTVSQNWSVASETTIVNDGGGKFGYFSSVCWFFGRQISDSLGPNVPIGLVSNNWGGTRIEQWTTSETLTACNLTGNDGNLFNAMINPYLVGPMTITGFAWYQGEQNTRDQEAADQYACLFPQMISAWRNAFGASDAYFGFVQISTWCNWGLGVPELREAQMSALTLPRTAYATNADHGAGCNIHPPNKQFVGERLGNSALAVQYGKKLQWRSPTYQSATASIAGGVASVTVNLNDVGAAGLTADVYPYNQVVLGKHTCEELSENNTKLVCGWASVQFSTGQWVNASVSVSATGKQMILSAPAHDQHATVTATSYGWAPIPMFNAYDLDTQLPVLAWNQSITHAMLV